LSWRGVRRVGGGVGIDRSVRVEGEGIDIEGGIKCCRKMTQVTDTYGNTRNWKIPMSKCWRQKGYECGVVR
jgi:hypothetical protein